MDFFQPRQMSEACPVAAEAEDRLRRGCRLRCLLPPNAILGFSSGENVNVKATCGYIFLSLDIHVAAWPVSV